SPANPIVVPNVVFGHSGSRVPRAQWPRHVVYLLLQLGGNMKNYLFSKIRRLWTGTCLPQSPYHQNPISGAIPAISCYPKGDELAFPQIAIKARAKADPHPQPPPDGYCAPAQSAGTEGDDQPGDCGKSCPGRI